MQEFANRNFVRGRNGWFNADAYDALVVATGHDPSSPNRKFLVSHDADPRHSFYMSTGQLRPKQVDRRNKQEGDIHYIPSDPKKDYVPSAPRVPDCIQCPIEMLFASVKSRYRELLKQLRQQRASIDVDSVVAMMKQAFDEKALIGFIRDCWGHAEKALKVFSAKKGEWVTIDGVEYRATGGNWLPKRLRG